VAPYTESAIVKGASIYSNACNAVKYRPKMIVNSNPWVDWVWFDSIIAWCDQVTVAPDARRIAVFNSGIWNGLNGVIPVGGQQFPISTVGESLLWKNAQKNEKKNKTSDTIKRIIPQRNPIATTLVCKPW